MIVLRLCNCVTRRCPTHRPNLPPPFPKSPNNRPVGPRHSSNHPPPVAVRLRQRQQLLLPVLVPIPRSPPAKPKKKYSRWNDLTSVVPYFWRGVVLTVLRVVSRSILLDFPSYLFFSREQREKNRCHVCVMTFEYERSRWDKREGATDIFFSRVFVREKKKDEAWNGGTVH